MVGRAEVEERELGPDEEWREESLKDNGSEEKVTDRGRELKRVGRQMFRA